MTHPLPEFTARGVEPSKSVLQPWLIVDSVSLLVAPARNYGFCEFVVVMTVASLRMAFASVLCPLACILPSSSSTLFPEP